MALKRSHARGAEASATALARYARLEALADYHDGRTARAREVIVKFGRASLTLMSLDDMPVAHWALASLRELDGPAGDAGVRLAPDPDGDERLTLRDPQMIAAIREVCPDLRARPAGAGGGALRRMAAWGAGALVAAGLLLFVILPQAADRLAPLIPPEQERKLGEAAVEQIAAVMGGGGACDARDGAAALERLTSRLARHAELPAELRVRVIRADLPNAFAAPGGQIVILSRLLEDAASPEEVAAVLAHEIGHVAARDPMREALRRAGTAGVLGLLVGDVFGGAVALALALADAAIAAAYSREAEEAADAYAHRLFADAGLPAAALAGFFERLAADGAEAEGLMRHFASHPDLTARAAQAREADVTGGAPFRPALTDAEWIALRQICD